MNESVEPLVVRIPGQINKRDLLRLLAQQLRFPGYFGHNWDALEECLSDLSWLPAGQPVTLQHLGLPLARRADQRQIYLEILRSATVAQQRPDGHPLTVIFAKRSVGAL